MLRFVDTGQHHDPALSSAFYAELELPRPRVVLGVGSAPHGAQTARVIERYERHLLELDEPPRAIVVTGDVNSTLGCALAAVKLNVPVVHIEAGLRSFDRRMPEEINRIVTDSVSSLLLASEESGVTNLRSEGVDDARVRLVGSLVIDTLCHEIDRARSLGSPIESLEARRYAYVTLHRPENVDHASRLVRLAEALTSLAERVPVVFPVHPRTQAALDGQRLSAMLLNRGVKLMAPVPYRTALALMDSAGVVITDSGGVQEETSQLGIPCLTLRSSTERPATVLLGTNVLVPDLDTLLANVAMALERERRPAEIPAWDGRAAERAIDCLCETYA